MANTDASIAFANLGNTLHVPSPQKTPAAAKTGEVVTDVVGEPPKPARNVMFSFTDDEKELLFDWLEVMELQQVTHKEYHLISEASQALLY